MKVVHFDRNRSVPLLVQVVDFVRGKIEDGSYKVGAKLPSINGFSKRHGLSRDTVEKGYNRLRETGLVVSTPGKGYYVTVDKGQNKLNILLLFNKLSHYKQVVYQSFLQAIGANANVDLQIFHYDPLTFGDIINRNLGKYHFYVVMPHFYQDANPEQYMEIIEKIPAEQLILLDKKLEKLPNHKGVFQDFKSDIYFALNSGQDLIMAYQKVELIFPGDRHHPTEIIEGVQRFCAEHAILFDITNDLTDLTVRKGTVYIVLTEDHLAQLIKMGRQSGWVSGKDFGIISFNETVFKELLDITVITTDFEQMGATAARLVLNNEDIIVYNPFKMISRKSLLSNS